LAVAGCSPASRCRAAAIGGVPFTGGSFIGGSFAGASRGGSPVGTSSSVSSARTFGPRRLITGILVGGFQQSLDAILDKFTESCLVVVREDSASFIGIDFRSVEVGDENGVIEPFLFRVFIVGGAERILGHGRKGVHDRICLEFIIFIPVPTIFVEDRWSRWITGRWFARSRGGGSQFVFGVSLLAFPAVLVASLFDFFDGLV
jgi:hypothetical protein